MRGESGLDLKTQKNECNPPYHPAKHGPKSEDKITHKVPLEFSINCFPLISKNKANVIVVRFSIDEHCPRVVNALDVMLANGQARVCVNALNQFLAL